MSRAALYLRVPTNILKHNSMTCAASPRSVVSRSSQSTRTGSAERRANALASINSWLMAAAASSTSC